MILPQQIIWTLLSSSHESHSPPCHPLQRHVKSISLFEKHNQPKDFKDDCKLKIQLMSWYCKALNVTQQAYDIGQIPSRGLYFILIGAGM